MVRPLSVEFCEGHSGSLYGERTDGKSGEEAIARVPVS